MSTSPLNSVQSYGANSPVSARPQAANEFTPPTPVSTITRADYLLIIDDSQRVIETLVRGIIKVCQMHERAYRLVHCAPEWFELKEESIPTLEGMRYPPLIIYTANSPSSARPVLALAELPRLIIISDISMPADREVGLYGMLKILAQRKLPVSLIFTSSENQNRAFIEDVLGSGKSYFIGKGSATWADLPFLLTENTRHIRYHLLETSDFDQLGYRQRRAAATATGPFTVQKGAAGPTTTPKAESAPTLPSRAGQVQVAPAYATPAGSAAVNPASGSTRSSFWSRLAFWRKTK